MSFARLLDHPGEVLDRICDGRCVYPNVAAMAYHFAGSHQDFGIVEPARALHDLLDQLYDGSISPDEIKAFVEEYLVTGDRSDDTTRAMFWYALDMDSLIVGRFQDLNAERRKQFVRMTFALAEQRLHSPEHLASHFLEQGVPRK